MPKLARNRYTDAKGVRKLNCYSIAIPKKVVEEAGIQFGIFLAQVTAGVSFEITNKQRNIGWFLKMVTLPFFIENFSRQEQK